MQEIQNIIWKWKRTTKIYFALKSRCCREEYYVYKIWNIDFRFGKLIEICEALSCEFWLWKVTLNFVHIIQNNKNCTFLDAFIISNSAIFTLFLGLYCNFYHVLKFLPYQHFGETNNNGVLSKNSWNMKK